MSRQIDNKKTMQVRIDKGYHHLLKIDAAKSKTTIKGIVEGLLAEYFDPEKVKEINKNGN